MEAKSRTTRPPGRPVARPVSAVRPAPQRGRRVPRVGDGLVQDARGTAPRQLYAAVSFDAVNRVFRDGKVFNSPIYDNTIGLFIGPTILAMEGKKHREHRNLVSAAFKSKSLARWEPEIVRPIGDALIDEFADAAQPTWCATSPSSSPPGSSRSCSDCPRKTCRGSAARRRTDQLHGQVQACVRGVRGAEGLLPHPDRPARSQPTEDIIGDLVTAEIDGEKLSDEAIYSFLRLLAARRSGDHLPVVGKPAVPAAHPPRPVRGRQRPTASSSRPPSRRVYGTRPR